ncbi:Protein TOXD [Grifola frondosa]|uniref:Protein TOXD n=1 Tax=Grifola frondosa TaxID=5627 RepID=A0A1C7LL12_GRIFR|nr:Protein TOXD [Grifola frondosa]
MKAVVMQEGYTVALIDQPVPTIGDDDILVKTVAVAQNPTDWRHAAHLGKPGMVIGLDWSGRVIQTGKHVSAPVVGQHVAGFVAGGTHAGSGAFAEYVKTPADLVWEVPEGTLSDEEASTLGCAFWTAVQGLYAPGRLGLVEPPAKVEGERWVLITAAAVRIFNGHSAVRLTDHPLEASVGQFAIQLAHISGYKVVTTASPRNLACLPPWALTPYSITTIQKCRRQGRACPLAHIGGEVRDDVEMMMTMVYTALGDAVDFGPEMRWSVSPEDRAHMVAFLKKVPKLVAEEKLKPNPVKLWEGGLAAVPEGLQHAREGKVRAEKIVYRV